MPYQKMVVPRSRLMLRTMELLRQRPRTLTVDMIAQDTGLHPGWIARLSNPAYGSPSVDAVVKLYEYLSGHPLDIK